MLEEREECDGREGLMSQMPNMLVLLKRPSVCCRLRRRGLEVGPGVGGGALHPLRRRRRRR